jgi:hypothetical protein
MRIRLTERRGLKVTPAELILWLFIGTPQERSWLTERAKSFCERHLVADDPYETYYRDADVPRPRTPELDKEIRARVNGGLTE